MTYDVFAASRRALLQTAVGAALLSQVDRAHAQSDGRPSPMTLWYSSPAAVWTEALPIGNGRLGAMVFGGVARERLQLNEDTLWAGAPYDPINPEARGALAEVRKLLFAGAYKEAAALTDRTQISRPAGAAAVVSDRR